MPLCIDKYEKSNHFYSVSKLALKIPIRDGGYLSANLYRPDADGQFPVLMTIGPYGKDTHYLEQNAMAQVLYSQVQDKGPLVSCGTPNSEFWVPQGYAVVRADQRGTGTASLECVKIPFLSAGNWFSAGMFSRGNIRGFLTAASDNKWLEMHIGSHFVEFYSEESRAMQKQFLDYWLKGIDTGLMRQPRIKLAIPEGENKFTWYYGNEYPLKNTHWFYYYLDASTMGLALEPPSQVGSILYKGDREKESALWTAPMQKPFDMSESDPHRVIFKTAPLKERMRLAGPIKLKLYAASSSDDMDIFITLRNIGANGKEVVGNGCYTRNYPVSQGWLRASLRKTDDELSTEYKPCYLYNEIQKLKPGRIYPLDIEIWDSAILFDIGNCLVLEIGSRDQSGCSLLMHTGEDRIWDADVTVHTGGENLTHLLLPLIRE